MLQAQHVSQLKKCFEFRGFKPLQTQIAELVGLLKQIGFNPEYFCQKFGIDREYYADWLTSGDVADFAELAILYLPEEKRIAIKEDLMDLAITISGGSKC